MRGVVGALLIVLLWLAVGRAELLNPIFFASLSEVVQEGIAMMREGSIFADLKATLTRVSISLLVSSVMAIPIGIAMGIFSAIRAYLSLVLDFFRSVPPVVVYPLMLICFGPSEASRIVTAVFGATTVMLLIIAEGVASLDRTRFRYFRAREVPTTRLLLSVVLFEVLPILCTALRAATSIALVVVVVTEMLVGGTSGLGARVQQVQITSNIPDLFATVLTIGVVGGGLNGLWALTQRKVLATPT